LTGADGSALGGLTGIIVGAANRHVIEWLFLISGGLTLAYMLKLFIAIFVEKNSDVALQKQYDSDRKGMNGLSALVIVGSSLFMFILGISHVAKQLASYMTSPFGVDTAALSEFAPFSWESLQGGLISLAIGILVYVFIVRKVFIKNGQYVNLWPAKLDLEEAVYRPLLTRVLPLILGTAARVIACSLDYLIAFARGTVLSERRPRTAEAGKRSERIMTLREGTNNVVNRVAENYTFAMMMACIGILVVLGTLVLILAL
jgi:hydrogenase-4 component B